MEEKFISKNYYWPKILLPFLIYSTFNYHSIAIAQPGDVMDDQYKITILQQIDSLLAAKYVLPDEAKAYADEFKQKYERGEYESLTEANKFAGQVTDDLRRITKDKHINFRVIEASDMGENPESTLHHPVRYHRMGIKENQGFSKLEWLEGNIGYLDIRRFYYFSDSKDLVAGAMKFLANADAIIIDIRENGGGSGDYLSSYFLAYPTQLNSWYSREEDFLEEYWTSKETGMKSLTDVPVFLLTSKRTFSASESFAYDMKVRGRATIVGDSTRGGAHSVDLFKIDKRFEIYIPTSRAINPLTGGNWEGTGIIPDINVPAETALDTAIVLARQAGAEFAKAREVKIKSAVEEMQNYMDRAEIYFSENKTGIGQAALDSVFRIANKQQLINEFFIDVLAYNYFDPAHEQILYAILKKKIEFFPASPGAYESLGYAYYKNHKKEPALPILKKYWNWIRTIGMFKN